MAHNGTRQQKSDLTELETREVSGVRRPAIGETFIVVKSEEEKPMDGQTPVAAAASDGEGAPGASDAAPDSGATLALAGNTKETLLSLAQAAQERLSSIAAILTSAAVDDSVVGAPDEVVMRFADVANMIASTVSPFIMRDGAVGGEDLEKSSKPADGQEQVAKGLLNWPQEYIDSLSDWCFAYVETSSTHDNDWRTTPLSNRHFPIRDHAGRLSLPGVIDAMEQIAAATPPFLSESKKRHLLLSLASERLCEVMIVVRREVLVPPETAAELAAITEVLSSVQQLISGNKNQVGAQPPAPTEIQPAAPAPVNAEVQQSLTTEVQKAVAAVKAIYVKKSEAPAGEEPKPVQMSEDAMRKACETMKSAIAQMEGAMGGSSAEQVAKSAGATGIDALVAKVEDLSKTVAVTKSELAQTKQDLAGARQKITKMERQTPPSNVLPDERVDRIAKGNPHESAAPPAISDFNALTPSARTAITKNADGRIGDFNSNIATPAPATEVGPINDFNQYQRR